MMQGSNYSVFIRHYRSDETLEAEMPRITNELKGLCKDRKDPEVHKILEKLDALETPNWKTILDVSGVLISIISLIKELYPAS